VCGRAISCSDADRDEEDEDEEGGMRSEAPNAIRTKFSASEIDGKVFKETRESNMVVDLMRKWNEAIETFVDFLFGGDFKRNEF
jgi:hypothetical protein